LGTLVAIVMENSGGLYFLIHIERDNDIQGEDFLPKLEVEMVHAMKILFCQFLQAL